MEKCIWTAHTTSKLKKENEFKDCLIELKNYCLQLNEQSAENLSEQSWNYVIQHFTRQVDFEEFAIHCYQTIVVDKQIANPNLFTLKVILKVVSNRGDLEMCGEIFEKLKEQNEYSLYTVSQYVNSCIKRQNLEKALNLIIEMKRNGIQPNYVIFIPMLKAATTMKNHQIGLEILKLIDNSNTAEIQLSMCVIKFALQAKIPQKVIEECERLKKQKLMDVITWSYLIQAYIQKNEIETAIQLIAEMEKNGTKPDSSTLNILISACAKFKLIEQGKYLHNLALKLENIPIDLWNSILNMYTKCNQPQIAIEIMEKIDHNFANVITWSLVIQAYIQMNQIEKSIQLLGEMEKNGTKPDFTTFIILITACANNNLFEQGKYLHNLALKLETISIDFWNSILSFYTKCNQPQQAIEECAHLRDNGLMNVVTWNCLLNAHFQALNIGSAFDSFQQMKLQNIEPDVFTYTILLSGCGDFVSQEKGLSIIQEIRNRGFETHEEIILSMINFYSKVGEKLEVEKLMKSLQKKDSILSIIAYNHILSHYAHHGNGIEAKKLFDGMVKNVEPNDQTFTIILNAFSHCGMISEAVNFFNDLELKYNHKPSMFNIGAMIDVYSRAGLFEQAELLIGDEMDFIGWNTKRSALSGKKTYFFTFCFFKSAAMKNMKTVASFI